MYCRNCGTHSPEGSAFCPKCGANLASEGGRRVPPPFPTDIRFQSHSSKDLFRRPTVVSILSVLHFVGGGAFLLAAVALTLAINRFDNSDSTQLLLIIGGICVLFTILHGLTGIGLWLLRPYGRTLQIILAALSLLSIPIGTVIGVLILIYMYKPEIKTLFSGKSSGELQPHEVQQLTVLRKQSSGSGAGIAIAIVAVLFLGIVFVGIISAIAIPNLLNAIQRGKQKRTMADIRSIATACEAYGVDNSGYPDASTMEDLASKLEPTYLKILPRQDGWEHAFQYEAFNEEGEPEEKGPNHYIIISTGKDGQPDSESYLKGTVTLNFNNDIVFSDGEFVVYPEAIQNR